MICFEDDDDVDVLVINEAWDPEIVVCLDIFELVVEVMDVSTLVEMGYCKDDTSLCLDPL